MFYFIFYYYYAFLFVFAGKVEGPEGTSDGAVSICQDVDFVLFFFLHGLLSRFGTDSPFIPPPPVALWVVVFLFRLFFGFFSSTSPEIVKGLLLMYAKKFSVFKKIGLPTGYRDCVTATTALAVHGSFSAWTSQPPHIQ